MIITQTVGQMTDAIPFTTVSTQTPLPRPSLAFPTIETNCDWVDKRILATELKLQTQRSILKSMDKELYFDRNSESESNLDQRNASPSNLQDPRETYVDSISPCVSDDNDLARANFPKKMVNSICEIITFRLQSFFHLLKKSNGPAFSYWEDFDVTDHEDELPDLPRKTISDGSLPWNSFRNLIIGDRWNHN